MTVEELFRTLSHVELSDLAVAVDGTGTIKEAQHPVVISHANDGLTRLYSHFLLSEKHVYLEQIAGVFRYPLLPGEAFIRDSAEEPFLGDVIRILGVYSAYGQPLPLNESSHPYSLLTPQAHVLQVPKVEPGTLLDVVYQARHPKLEAQPLDQEIQLPIELEEALRAYIAYKMYSAKNTQEAQKAARDNQMRFDAICNSGIQTSWMNQASSGTNTKFHTRGWV